MTTATGAWAPNGSTNQRMRLVLDYTVSAVSNGAVTVSGSVRVEAGYSFNDSSNTFAWSGSLLGSGSSAKSINVASNGSQQIHTFSQSVSVSGQPASSRTATFSLTGVEYVGSSTTATISATIAIPAGQVSLPSAPTGPGADRVSDTVHNLYWFAAPTTEAPIQGFHLELETVGVGWTRLGNPGSTVRAWQTQSTKPDSRHRMRVRSFNSAGASAWATTVYWRTTPAAATNLTVARTGQTTATLTWTNNAKHAQTLGIELAYSDNAGATWSAWESWATGLAVTTTSYPATNLTPGRTYRYRVVTGVTEGTALQARSNVAELPPMVAPGQPTLESPTGTYPSSGVIPFRWRHNALDGSGQTAYELRYRLVGDPTWITLTGTSAQTRDIAAPDPGLYEWQVRTKGQHADFGAWSTVGRWQMAHPPTVTIYMPVDGSTRTTNWLTVAWNFHDPQDAVQTAWRAELLDITESPVTVEVRSGTGRTTVTTFRTLLTNGRAYRARVWLTSGTGLSSDPDQVDVAVSFLSPQPPSLMAAWDEERGETSLAIGTNPGVYQDAAGDWVFPGEVTHLGDGLYDLSGTIVTYMGDGVYEVEADPAQFAEAASHAIERSLDGGETWERIADGLPFNAGHGDWRVPLNVDAIYRAVAITALGVEASSAPVEVRTESGRVWLHSITGQQHASLRYNLSLSRSKGHQVEAVQYLGDPYPTAHFGPALPESVSVSAATFADEPAEPLEVMLQQVVWYRDPERRAWWAIVGSDVTESATFSEVAQVGLSVRRVMPPVEVSA